MFAQIRFEVYVKIRQEIRENMKKELSKRELKTILKALDLWKIRNSVFDLYNLSELNEPTHRTLIKAHIKFLCQDSLEEVRLFESEMREIRQSHQRYMTAILSTDVFPKLEKSEPILTQDDEIIPDKFGKKWFEHQQGIQGSQIFKSVFINEDSDEECAMREKDFNNLSKDIWHHKDI